MRTDYTDLMYAVQFKDTVNAYKANHKQDKFALLQFLKDEVIELEEAMHDPQGRKAYELLEVADIVVFAGMLYELIKQEPRK